MSKKQFWIRLSVYVLFGLLAPLAFLLWRFDFLKSVSEGTKLSGWGTFAVAFIFIFFLRLMKSVRKGMPFSYWAQLLDGIIKVIIPLIICTVVLNFMKNFMEEFSQFLIVLILCETVAVFTNPLKEWAHENNVEYETLSILNAVKSILNIK